MKFLSQNKYTNQTLQNQFLILKAFINTKRIGCYKSRYLRIRRDATINITMYARHTGTDTVIEITSGTDCNWLILLGSTPCMLENSSVSIPIKSGIGVRLDINFMGKKTSMLSGKNILIIGSIIIK